MKVRRSFYKFAATIFSVAAMHSFAAITYVEATVPELLHRDYGTHIKLQSPATTNIQSLGLQCPGPSLPYPLVLFSGANYKTYRDTLMSAYALKREVRIYFETTQACYAGVYPIIFGIDLMQQR
jgi:hypothetical protein